MDFNDLRYLSTAFESRQSFACCSAAWGSRRRRSAGALARLEDEVGVTILERGVFGIRLTATGREVMVQLRHALGSFDRVMRVGWSRGSGKERPCRARRPQAPDRPAMRSFWRPGVGRTRMSSGAARVECQQALRRPRGTDAGCSVGDGATLRRGVNAVSIYRKPA